MRTAVLCALCAIAPDIDAIGFRFGIPYGHWLGHRGFTHSILFAILLGGVLSFLIPEKERFSKLQLILFAAFSFSVIGHDLLDAITDGGLGIGFFSPFNNRRYFLPWRPIEVSPLSAAGLFSGRGLTVLKSELLWIMLPSLFVLVTARLGRLLLKQSSRRDRTVAGG